MEQRVNKLIEKYFSDFKNDIRDTVNKLGLGGEEVNDLLKFVYDYEHLEIDNEEFIKRKRVKNIVPVIDRCIAKRSNNEQCTRRKKDDNNCYCGTHMKGLPHGIMELVASSENNNSYSDNSYKIEVWGQDINGIIYYLDKKGNIYKAEDIIIKKFNPNIIGKYSKNGDKYSISLHF